MAIISSNIGESNFPPQRRELSIVNGNSTSEKNNKKKLNISRPKRLNEFIGQEHIKSSLRVAIDASIYRKEALEHTLLYGQPGLGKTTLAFLIANEMNTTLPQLPQLRDQEIFLEYYLV